MLRFRSGFILKAILLYVVITFGSVLTMDENDFYINIFSFPRIIVGVYTPLKYNVIITHTIIH